MVGLPTAFNLITVAMPSTLVTCTSALLPLIQFPTGTELVITNLQVTFPNWQSSTKEVVGGNVFLHLVRVKSFLKLDFSPKVAGITPLLRVCAWGNTLEPICEFCLIVPGRQRA